MESGDGDVAVGAHRVDGGAYLGKLGGVAAVVGIDDGLVDREVDICRCVELASFHRLSLG